MVVIKSKDKSLKSKALKIATFVIPPLMATLGYFYADVRPAVADFCALVLN